jgi:hypothetical protein
MPTLNWSETAQVIGPYAELTYKAKNNLNLDDTDFQEIPAIYMHQGIGTYFYYYTGSSPYKDASGPVTRVTSYQGMLGAYQLPGRQGPFGVGSVAGLTEDWMSSCDQTETKCMTVATFSSLSQDIIAGDDENSSYFGIHGFFSLTNNMNMIARVFVFPYRFDDIVMGKSIRQWIYRLSHNGMNRR